MSPRGRADGHGRDRATDTRAPGSAWADCRIQRGARRTRGQNRRRRGPRRSSRETSGSAGSRPGPLSWRNRQVTRWLDECLGARERPLLRKRQMTNVENAKELVDILREPGALLLSAEQCRKASILIEYLVSHLD